MKKVISRKYSENKLELDVVDSNFNLNDIDRLIKSLQRIKEEGFDKVTLTLESIKYVTAQNCLESVSILIEGYLAVLETDEQYTNRLTKELEEVEGKKLIEKDELKKKELQLLKRLKEKYEA